MVQSQMVGGPGIEIVSHAVASEVRFVDRDLNFERHEHTGSDVLTHHVHIVDSAGKAVGPYDAAILRVGELHSDDNIPIQYFDGSAEAIAHSQQRTYLTDIAARRL